MGMKPFLTVEVNSKNATGELVRHVVRRIIPHYFGATFEQEALIAVADISGMSQYFYIEFIGQDPHNQGGYNEMQVLVKTWDEKIGEEQAYVCYSSLFNCVGIKPRASLTLAAHLAGDYIKAFLESFELF